MQTLLLLSALASLSAPADTATRAPGAHAEASASIRIVKAVRIDREAVERGIAGAHTETRTLVEPDGLTRQARLVEFE